MGQEQNSRPAEMPAVRTTIVGGRPPGSGKMLGAIPRGIEVLVKKAVVDPEFRALLLARRARAADEIGLVLTPQETLMLNHVPAAQLEAIIARTRVDPSRWNAFLSKAAGVMLAALGASAALSDTGCVVYQGQRPDVPPPPQSQPATAPAQLSISEGIRPNRRPETRPASRPTSQPNNIPMAGEGDERGPNWPDVAGAKADRPPVLIAGEMADVPTPSPSPATRPASRPASGPASQPASQPALSAKELHDLVRQLDDDKYSAREAAQKRLMDQGVAILPRLRGILGGGDLSPEAKTRLETILVTLTASTQPAPTERPDRIGVSKGLRAIGP